MSLIPLVREWTDLSGSLHPPHVCAGTRCKCELTTKQLPPGEAPSAGTTTLRIWRRDQVGPRGSKARSTSDDIAKRGWDTIGLRPRRALRAGKLEVVVARLTSLPFEFGLRQREEGWQGAHSFKPSSKSVALYPAIPSQKKEIEKRNPLEVVPRPPPQLMKEMQVVFIQELSLDRSPQGRTLFDLLMSRLSMYHPKGRDDGHLVHLLRGRLEPNTPSASPSFTFLATREEPPHPRCYRFATPFPFTVSDGAERRSLPSHLLSGALRIASAVCELAFWTDIAEPLPTLAKKAVEKIRRPRIPPSSSPSQWTVPRHERLSKS
ncbi:hypothetical protein BDK51DRAFT_44568 [Blyttiomyces helicus]|uniref:Uncharacterized protein n=1 Tax=Blyttiomyces helicus TaxID=388810 RepID=A0A4P9WHS4_9FUNG|nr:hypothetical protein BDK51DRAFT_44568 [Blyttiomyces helicus]|eukprot:RKO90096.1 hypothetical protein BDK51DRAFT_44568 [Blyttiomyces helicus]